MRPFILFALAFPLPALADTFELPATIDRVTVYPQGANVTRLIEIAVPAGVHELIIPDLPYDTDASTLRVKAPDGVTIGSVNLATGRLPVTSDNTSPEVEAAFAEVERLEGVLRDRDADIAAIRLAAEAANEQVAFLRSLGQGKATEGMTAVDDLRALSQMVGTEVLAARLAAHKAEQEAGAAERAKQDDVEALNRAEQALDALQDEGPDRSVLTLAIQSDGKPATLEITTYYWDASWLPVYDMRLTRVGAPTPSLDLDRSVIIAQRSGEDWMGVDLTLSTARPSEQSNPTFVYAEIKRIESQAEIDKRMAEEDLRMRAGTEMYSMAAPVAEPMIEPEVIVEDSMSVDYEGVTAVYNYGTRVDIRNGVEDLRLRLDTLTFAPTLVAEAAPALDASAYLMAELTNTGTELLLPGEVTLFLDGAMIGGSEIGLLPVGEKADIGFGAIDGIRLTRTVPQRSEGDRGTFSKSNQIDEVAILSVENLTGEAWPMRVLDAVPYSEQDDLVIRYNATPPVTEADPDGRRGVLAWEFDLAAGAKREIRLEHTVTWPVGWVLR